MKEKPGLGSEMDGWLGLGGGFKMNCYNRILILMKFVDPGVLQLSSLADDFKKDQLLLIQWL